jgi:cell envelope opacity-associated protein A
MIFIRQLKNNTYKQSNHTTRRKGASLMKIEQNRNWRRAREEKKNPWRVGHSRLRLKRRSNEAVNPFRPEKREEQVTAPFAEQKARSALRPAANGGRTKNWPWPTPEPSSGTEFLKTKTRPWGSGKISQLWRDEQQEKKFSNKDKSLSKKNKTLVAGQKTKHWRGQRRR